MNSQSTTSTTTTTTKNNNTKKYHPSMKNHYYSNTNNNISYKQEESIMNIDTYSVPRSVSNDDDYEEDDNKENDNKHITLTSNNGKNSIGIRSNHTKVELSSTKVNTNNNINNNDVENYLKTYETMIQQQEHVEQTVLTHLIPCIKRLIHLMNTDPTTRDSNNEPQQGINQKTYYKPIQLHDEISYVQLYKVYQQLEQIKLPTGSNNENNTTTSTTPMTISYLECMTTDKQLMMVLRILTEPMNHENNITPSGSTNTKTSSTTITWAEFILCYQICIISMMTIQYIPKKTYARIRTRERSISILHLFQNHYMNSSISSTTTNFGINDSIYPIQSQQQQQQQNLIHEYQNLIQNSYTSTGSMTNSNHSIDHVPKVDIPRQQQQRRRPWLKKRTKRIVSKILLLIVTMTMLYVLLYTFVVQMVDTNRLSSSILVSFLSLLLPMYHSTQNNNINHSNQQQQFIIVAGNQLTNEYNHSLNTMNFVDNTNSNKKHVHNNDDINIMDYHIIFKNKNPYNDETIPDRNKHHDKNRNVLKVQPTRYHPLLGIWSNF